MERREMSDNALFATFWICATVAILTAICVGNYWVGEEDRLRYENNYCQVQKVGTTSTLWVKCK